MKLFFVVLGSILAVGFVSWMTLSLAQIAHHHNGLVKKPRAEDVQRSH